MILRTIKGAPGSKLESAFTDKIEKGLALGLVLNQSLTTTHVMGDELVYSLVFQDKKKLSSPRADKKVKENTETERILMQCFGTRFIDENQSRKIKESQITVEDAKQILQLYQNTKHLDKEDRNAMAMKTTFAIMVNNLGSMLEVATAYNAKHKPRAEKKEEAKIPEPQADWRGIANEIYPMKGMDYWQDANWQSLATSNGVQKEIIENL